MRRIASNCLVHSYRRYEKIRYLWSFNLAVNSSYMPSVSDSSRQSAFETNVFLSYSNWGNKEYGQTQITDHAMITFKLCSHSKLNANFSQ